MSCSKSCNCKCHEGGSCCGCNCDCSCHEKEGCHHDHHENFSDELLELADDAWMEILFDKIKDEIEKTSGDRLTQLAQLVSRTNHERWKEKLAGKNNCENFKHEIRKFFDGNGDSCCKK